MLNQSELTSEVAAFKKDAKRRFDEAVSALITLAWPYRREDFVFDGTFPLYDDALGVCMTLSDRCASAARERMEEIIASSLDYADADAAWDAAYGDEEQRSFDMAGSHLLELLAVWIAVAAREGWTDGYLRVMISRYLANPFLCPEWRSVPLDALAWGRGYAKNIPEQLAVIGQGVIVSGARHAEQVDAVAKGAEYYVRHRGSGYECDVCDSMVNIPIPVDVPFEIPHPRCVCYPEYFYE